MRDLTWSRHQLEELAERRFRAAQVRSLAPASPAMRALGRGGGFIPGNVNSGRLVRGCSGFRPSASAARGFAALLTSPPQTPSSLPIPARQDSLKAEAAAAGRPLQNGGGDDAEAAVASSTSFADLFKKVG